MRPRWNHAFVCAGLSAWSALCVDTRVRADDVHLEGGNVIEGKVVRDADRVTIELESGRITLSADSVQRIDRRESSVEQFERAHAALKSEDVKGRMALADYCRDHGMRTRERQVLQEVIERAPDHEDARARLGFVKSDGTWITREAQYRAQGMVQVDGMWMTRDKALELSRLREQAQTAVRERQRAEIALEAERLAVRKRELELQQKRLAAERAAAAPTYVAPSIYRGYYYPRRDVHIHNSATPHTQPFPINGVRDPRDMSFPINGVRDPRDMSFPINGVRDPQDFLRRR